MRSTRVYSGERWMSMKFFLGAIQLLLIAVYVPVVYGAPLQSYKEGELIVRFKNPLKAAKSVSLQKSSIIRKFERLPVHHIKLPAGVSVQEALASFRSDPNVLYAEPNYRVRKSMVPNDPSYGAQWHLPLISAPAAWDIFAGSRAADSIIVAVLDTGMAYSHPDLAPNVWVNSGEVCGDGIDNDNNGIVDDCYGANFGSTTQASGDPWDDDTADSHGTHVSGLVGAIGNNNAGVTGVNWAVRIMAVKFLHGPEGMGDLIDALRGVEYALSKGAKIINMSFEVDEDSGSLRDTVTAAENAGVLVISAAGNTGQNLDQTAIFPASVRSPVNIAVAATTSSDTMPSYSDYGRHTVELAAPGGFATGSADAVLSTVWLDNGTTLYRTTAGTSMAAPQVTGAAALIWNLHPSLSAVQVKARILNGVDHIPAFAANTISGGRLNLEKALNAVDIPTVFDVSPYQLNWNGGTITIKGANFGGSPGSIALAGTAMIVNAWNDTEITAVIPQNAQSGTVRVNGQGSGFPVTIVPLITLSASSVSGVAPLTVDLTAEIRSAASISKYEWDLGEGTFKTIPGTTSQITHTFTIEGTYYIRFRITDNTGNIVVESLTITATTETVTLPTAPENNGYCFIATAAYGSYLHPHVRLLREFRDTWLLTNAPGRAFVSLYYRWSPQVAAVISEHDTLRILFRWALTPMVCIIRFPMLALIVIIASILAGGRSLRFRSRSTTGCTAKTAE